MGNTIRESLAAAIEEISGFAVGDDDSIALEALEIDSLGLIEVGMLMEEELGFQLDAEMFAGVTTLGDALGVFERVQREQLDAVG